VVIQQNEVVFRSIYARLVNNYLACGRRMLLKTTSPTQTVAAFRTCQLHILIDADNSLLVGHVF
jgi:hypothetical protein